MVKLQFHQVAFNSPAGINYLVLVHDPDNGQTALVDAGSVDAAMSALADTGWSLSEIWITHHHFDHVEGLAEIKTQTGATAIGPRDQTTPIAGLDRLVGGGDSFDFAGHTVNILHTPGHTNDMVNYHIPSAGVVFTGDTLFSLGCGRMFEGTPAQFSQSLKALAALPADTMVYCGHEYTESNGAFALSIDPSNTALAARMDAVKALRAKGEPTVPFHLGQDRAANPFMRCDSVDIRAHLDMQTATDAEVFGEIRARKDAF